MILNTKYTLLFIEPKLAPTTDPVIDEYTLKLAYQLKNVTHTGSVTPNGGFIANVSTLGVHTCSCGMRSASFDFLLPCGLATNKLALHYLMYHRAEVPTEDLEKIASRMPYHPDITIDEEIYRTVYDLRERNQFLGKQHVVPFDLDRSRLHNNKGGYTLPELKGILTYMCLDTKGKKVDLIERISEYL